MAEGVHKRMHSMDDAAVASDALDAFYERAAAAELAPLWKVLAGMVTPEPQPAAVPHLWRFEDVRPYLLEACELITAEQAERRVLILENPGLCGQSRVCASLFAGLQIIMPGEVAPAHRHVASALRFIVEGEGAYTAVDGERTMMSPGDFVITPTWRWHDHANEGPAPVIWLDGLDMHIVNLFGASFREESEEARKAPDRPADTSRSEFGYSMAPADHAHDHSIGPSPIINYPLARTKEALAAMQSHRAPDPHHGWRLKYLNPTSGDWAMPTIATWMRALPAGFETRSYRSTDSTIFCVVEGEGKSRIGETEITWKPHDVFVAPSWAAQTHFAARDALIFTYSDRAAQEKLGLWRERRAESTVSE